MDFDTEAALKSLSDANRLRIVKITARKNPACAQDYLEELDITQPTLSHHMKALANCGLITCERMGRWCRYYIDKEHAAELVESLNELFDL